MEFGFQKLDSSECVFVEGNGSQKGVLMVCINDLITMSLINETVDKKKGLLGHKFQVEDLRNLQYYLEIKLKRRGDQMVLNHGAY